MGVHWKDWCWSWNANTLATSREELTHWKRPWCWEGLGAGGEGEDREWDGWMASLTRWAWVWVNGSLWWKGGLVCCNSWGHKESDTTERLNWTVLNWLWVIANEALQKSLNSWQISIEPLAKVVLENRIVLDFLSLFLSLSLFFFFLPDYLLTKQGGIYSTVSITYCTWMNIFVKSSFKYITFKMKSIGYNKCNLFHIEIWIYSAGYLQNWAQGLNLYFNLLPLSYLSFFSLFCDF